MLINIVIHTDNAHNTTTMVPNNQTKVYPGQNSAFTNLDGTTPRPVQPKYTVDREEATYYWDIYLTPGHPANKPNARIFNGYSKFQGNEDRDKIRLLITKFDTLLSRYLYQSDQIMVYKNMPKVPKANFPMLMELNKSGYILYGELQGNLLLTEALQQFYDTFDPSAQFPPLKPQQGQNTVPTRGNYGQRKAVWHEILNHATYRFTNRQALLDFCREMTDHPVYQFGKECMVIWYKTHYRFQPELYSMHPEEEFRLLAAQRQKRRQRRLLTRLLPGITITNRKTPARFPHPVGV